MTHFSRRSIILTLASVLVCRPAFAAPTQYQLDTKSSKVGFRFSLSGVEQTGSMPVERADIVIDPKNLSASMVDVVLRVAGARTSLIFATQALIGPDVLDSAQFPTIRFVSDKVQLAQDGRLSGGARIAGKLTMHGVTKPVTLDANLYRARGSAADDLGELTVQLSGQVSRSAFGASGYADLVDDIVGLDITAVISAVN